MPDGLTHIVAGYIGGQRWLKDGRLTLFLLGCLMPDIILRGGRLLFMGHPQRDFLELFLTPLHTPITSLFLCLAIAQLFDSKIRRASFTLLFGGCLAHFFLDLLQCTISGYGFTVEKLDGYHWLYPASWFDFQIGFFWAEDASYALIFLLPMSIWLWVRDKTSCHRFYRIMTKHRILDRW